MGEDEGLGAPYSSIPFNFYSQTEFIFSAPSCLPPLHTPGCDARDGGGPHALAPRVERVKSTTSLSPGRRGAATARSARGWYRPSVGGPRDVGCRRSIRVANLFSVQFTVHAKQRASSAGTLDRTPARAWTYKWAFRGGRGAAWDAPEPLQT